MAHAQDMILLAPPYGRSYAHFSEAKPEERTCAVVFVHGLFGDAVSTWWQFQTLIDRDEVSQYFWDRCDLYFYSYDSLGHYVSELSQQLRGFLDVVFPTPSMNSFELGVLPEIREILAPGVPTKEPTLPARYTSLFLVGHSLGGVVIRQALLDCAATWKMQASQREWAKSYLTANVRLFSPAIRGFQPTGVKGFLYHYAATHPLLSAAFESLKTLQELRKDSQRLLDLQNDTERFASEYDWMTALTANLLFASSDIVYTGRYGCDLVERIVPGHDHESICKPNPKYPEPLWFVSQGVNYERSSSARR